MAITSLLDAPRSQVSALTKAQFQKLPLQHQRIIIILEQIAYQHNLGYSGTGKDRGINQLAQIIGINSATLQTYLRGQSDPLGMRTRIFDQIAKARNISAVTLRLLLDGKDEESESPEEIRMKFLEYCQSVDLQFIPEGIVLLASRLNGLPVAKDADEGDEDMAHEGNLRLWELVEQKWGEIEEALGYEPEQMDEEEFLQVADRQLKGEAKVVFDLLRNSTTPIENKYLTGGLAKFLGKSPADLIKIRDGRVEAITDA